MPENMPKAAGGLSMPAVLLTPSMRMTCELLQSLYIFQPLKDAPAATSNVMQPREVPMAVMLPPQHGQLISEMRHHATLH